MITLHQAIEYDVKGNWLASHTKWAWIFHYIWTNHLKRKAHRKYARYLMEKTGT